MRLSPRSRSNASSPKREAEGSSTGENDTDQTFNVIETASFLNILPPQIFGWYYILSFILNNILIQI